MWKRLDVNLAVSFFIFVEVLLLDHAVLSFYFFGYIA